MQPIYFRNMMCLALLAIVFASKRHYSFNSCRHTTGLELNAIHERSARSAIDCSTMCLENDMCESATYRKPEKKCALMKTGYRFNEPVCDCLPEAADSHFIYRKDYPCYYRMPINGSSCQCSQGFLGDFCEVPPRDCSDYTPVYCKTGYDERIIYPAGGTSCAALTIFCARCVRLTFFRSSGKFPTKSNATWETFKFGFGRDQQPEYWLGNEYMHQITASPHSYKMYIKIRHAASGNLSSHIYHDVSIGDETTGYKFSYTTFEEKGNPKIPANKIANGSPFRTHDRDNDGCVSQHGAAYWYTVTCSVPSPLGGTYFINNEIATISTIHGYIQRS